MLKILKIIHAAFILGICIFGIIVYYLTQNDLKFDFSFENPLEIFVLLVIAISGVMHRILPNKILEQLKKDDDLPKKKNAFMNAEIVKYATIEAPSFFCVVVTMLTQNALFLIIACLLVLYFYTLKPSLEKVVLKLKLSPSEVKEIQ